MSIANAYFRDGQYNEASYNYDLLCKDYPKSGYQKKAHLLNLQSKIRIYQGTAYDGNPLKDAEKIADRTLSQFGSDLGDERERVVQTRMQIIEERASRDFVRGEYYEQKKYYGAARMYYKGVIEEFPGTEKAREARERYDKIRNLPDQPPDRWKWLREAIDKR
jgi:outer membrane protein assembly factor BamD (BamD/ComL family)